jgi:phosphonate transport system substrate-binding protein
MRDIDFKFTSYFLIAKDNQASNISDLKNNSFSFGSKLSTSGHIMPRFFLSTQDIVPETFFSQVLYSGAHDKTALWVQNGEVDVGVVNSVVLKHLYKDKIINKNKIKVLWETPSYPDYVWAARQALPKTLKTRIIEAFIKLSLDNKEDRQLLQQMGTSHYFPANSDDFEPIRKIAYQLDMLNDEQ